MKQSNKILIDAKALISDPNNWTNEGYYALNGDGEGVPALAEDAVKWCAVGAIDRVGGDNTVATDRAYFALASAIDGSHVPYYNDSHSHADVLKAFDKAIQRNTNIFVRIFRALGW